MSDRTARNPRGGDANANGSGREGRAVDPTREHDGNVSAQTTKRGFELMFRVYAPRKEFFDKAWVLPDVERVAQ